MIKNSNPPVDSNMFDVLGDEKYLSSEHERESDSIRYILEENDDIYDEINYMEPFDKIKNDPSRLSFLKDFQDEIERQEEKEANEEA